MGDEVARIIEALQDEHWRVRWRAVVALGDRGNARAVAPLIQVLRSEDRGDWLLCWEAVVALGKISNGRAVEPLVEALKDENPDLRCEAAWALAQIAGRDPVPELRNALPVLHHLLRARLAQGGEASRESHYYRTALQKIEEATSALKDLPLPASPPLPSPKDLPLPAQVANFTLEHLPVPADPADSSAPPALPGRSWREWIRRVLRLR